MNRHARAHRHVRLLARCGRLFARALGAAGPEQQLGVLRHASRDEASQPRRARLLNRPRRDGIPSLEIAEGQMRARQVKAHDARPCSPPRRAIAKSMSRDDWSIVRLQKAHRRDVFDCGSDELRQYLRRFARQNEKTGFGRTYVAVLPDEVVVRGHYTLTTSAVERGSLPDDAKRGLPRYPVPTARIARLATDKPVRGLGLGRDLLMDAIYRITQAADEIGIHAVEVDAKDATARSFYERYGLIALLDQPRHMFLSIKTAKRAFS